ncbi:FtsK/SpoIIIE domain-containing protein [Catellatospora tritici]|uniref:FtsK/SpoIIIE domain-containing protein n=1 Tax=Catellatospora tritici TaxID=2851566 RepID=UPI001C2CF75A|nr:FtsK/SpoIIIE domain-containing protein [Catellatospora tritici]MBV1850737.1 FHA domain-containing protein [Catellatospora tritici]MBV1850990.1 FHA domain-containing protein [Catellatospora tritici]
MRFVFRLAETEHELELRLGRPDATVADLAAALGLGGDLLVDGKVSRAETALVESGLVSGSQVSAAGAEPTVAPPPLAVLRVVGGLEAGRSVPLHTGRTTLGRAPEAGIRLAAPDVSRVHCALDVALDGRVQVSDLSSLNGTDVDGERITGPVTVGADDVICLAGQVLVRVLPSTRLERVQHVNPVREARPGGTMPFNRPPRPAVAATAEAVRVPGAPPSPHRTPFNLALFFGPLVMAVVMVMVLGDWRYALFALLSPMMFIGEFVEQRTRGRISLRRGRRDHAKALEAARTRLAALRVAEIRARRAYGPDPAELLALAQSPGVRLWERRPDSPDFLQLSVGVADQQWQPVLVAEGGQEPDPAAVRELGMPEVLPQVPVLVSAAAGAVVGLQGDRSAALAVARSLLCQAVVTSGPADVTVAVFTDTDRAADWDWTKWIPHGTQPRAGTARLVAVGDEQSSSLARALLAAGAPEERQRRQVLLVVVDGAALLEGRPCPLRELLATGAVPCGAIVLTDRLPALCTSVLTVGGDRTGRLSQVTTGAEVTGILLQGMAERYARRTARALARFDDPELPTDGAGLPDRINLLPLLGLPEVSGGALAARWGANADALRVRAVLGVSERELFGIDLDDDGPHGLIAGTTGSGKSELLRTMIAAMAVETDPQHLTFVLVDYKGGGALDECARLPHVVGLVTDLDEQLGERALRCMEAELKYREHALRDAGVSHVRDYQRLRRTQRPELEPMPRLVVVIDEFATLVKSLPDFVDSLVSIAQRGRSLGMHLIMATQRPAGSVSDAIKNNVKLRIALRLESTGDSLDVIDSPVAAGIGSRQWGRAYYRLSAREMLPVQTALSTGVTPTDSASSAVAVVPFGLVPAARAEAADTDGEHDLLRIVGAAQAACQAAAIAPARRPWPDPLPAVVTLDELGPVHRGLQTDLSGRPAIALADDPDRQAQYPVGWDLDAGNLLVYGAVGAGTTTALATLALAAATAAPPDRQHLYVLDLGAGELAPLERLPHTGAYIGAADRERQSRLIRLLRRELDARKAGAPQTPWLVLIDNVGALLADYNRDVAGMALAEELSRVYADGPAVGVHLAATSDRSGAVPGPWAASTQQKLLLRLADPNEYGVFDVPRVAVPAFTPGRAVVAATRQVVQLACPGGELAEAVAAVGAAYPGARRSALSVGALPPQVRLSELGVRAELGAEPWSLPIGVGAESLSATGLSLYEQEHAVVTGPSRSGRSTALCTIALAALAADPAPAVVAFTPRRSPLREVDPRVRSCADHDSLRSVLSATDRPTLLLVDDAEAVTDQVGDMLDTWLASGGPGRHLVAAGRAEGMRRAYGGWIQRVRDCRTGVLLVPDHDLDGDLLGVALPRHDRMAPLPGRGYLVANGTVDGIQLALPPGL